MHYDRAFYVIPDRREMRTPGYCRRVQQEAQLPLNHQIVTASAFEEAVEKNLHCRKKKEASDEPKNSL